MNQDFLVVGCGEGFDSVAWDFMTEALKALGI